MKQFILYILPLLLTACADSIIQEPDDTARTPIDFRPSVSRAVTTAVTDFDIWGHNGEQCIFEGVTVTQGTDGWSYGDPLRYWENDKSYCFASLYPASVMTDYDKTWVKNATLCDTTSILTNYRLRQHTDVDLVLASHSRTCTADDPTSKDPVALTFNHVLARINFTAKPHSSISSGTTVEITEATVFGMSAIGNLHVNGTWSINEMMHTTEQYPMATMDSAVSFSQSDTDGVKLYGTDGFYVLPQTVGVYSQLSIKYTITRSGVATNYSHEYSLTLASSAIGGEWKAGRSYSYNFEIIDDGNILFTAPKVAAWEENSGNNIIIQIPSTSTNE